MTKILYGCYELLYVFQFVFVKTRERSVLVFIDFIARLRDV